METRKILIANQKTQRRYEIQSNATTLGELQDQMLAMGIDFTGMDFTEGISKTNLVSRDSQLPTNVMFKGQPTNDLVMLLTNTSKNISSGAISRKEAYALVKKMRLQDCIKEAEGENYTRVKTDVLESWINAARNREIVTEPVEAIEEPAAETCVPDVKSAPHPEAVEWYYMGLKAMLKSGLLYTDDVAVLASLTTDLYKRLKEAQPIISDSDIDDMLASI